tara:strand:- start:12156 stop:12887 length:732 start_codon:yes stop_codon:yes gene_type:complete
MIEKNFPQKKIKEFKIKEYIGDNLDKPGYSHTEIQRTPLGERVVIYTSKPGIIVGRKGENIQKLTEVLRKNFGLENPQVEVSEIGHPNLNPQAVAKHIVHTFERFGPSRFKFTGHNMLKTIIDAGAIGAEIVISGRGVPSSRSKTWRFKQGYLKKSGDVSENHVKYGYAVAHLKSGAVGIKVSILTPDIELPDKIEFISASAEVSVEKEEGTDIKEEVSEAEKTVEEKVEVKQESKENGDIKK